MREQLHKDYGNLARIAHARGDAAAAAWWQAKYEARREELDRLERGEGAAPRVDEQLVQFILELAQACYAIRTQSLAMPPDVAEALEQLSAAPAPLNTVGAFLRAVAGGGPVPSTPAGLPEELEKIVAALGEAVRG